MVLVPGPINYKTYSADVGWVRRGSLRRNPTNLIFTKVGASRQPRRVGKTHQPRRLEGRLGFVGLRDKAANPTYMSPLTPNKMFRNLRFSILAPLSPAARSGCRC